jgi:hypothetical protein
MHPGTQLTRCVLGFVLQSSPSGQSLFCLQEGSQKPGVPGGWVGSVAQNWELEHSLSVVQDCDCRQTLLMQTKVGPLLPPSGEPYRFWHSVLPFTPGVSPQGWTHARVVGSQTCPGVHPDFTDTHSWSVMLHSWVPSVQGMEALHGLRLSGMQRGMLPQTVSVGTHCFTPAEVALQVWPAGHVPLALQADAQNVAEFGNWGFATQ